MRISRETDYAIRCTLFIAGNPGKVRTAGEIARAQEIPESFLAKILQKLVRARILASSRGVGGGFRLARRPSRITLLEVIEATGGPLAINECLVDESACPRKSLCAAHPVWKEIREDIAEKLGRYDMQTLLDSSPESGSAAKIVAKREGA